MSLQLTGTVEIEEAEGKHERGWLSGRNVIAYDYGEIN